MIATDLQKPADCILSIADKLRARYRPLQYRKVMLPLIVKERQVEIVPHIEWVKALRENNQAIEVDTQRIQGRISSLFISSGSQP